MKIENTKNVKIKINTEDDFMILDVNLDFTERTEPVHDRRLYRAYRPWRRAVRRPGTHRSKRQDTGSYQADLPEQRYHLRQHTFPA